MGMAERSLHGISAEFEGDDDDERLNREQGVEEDDCCFHCWGMGDDFRKAMLPVHLAIPAMNAADGGGVCSVALNRQSLPVIFAFDLKPVPFCEVDLALLCFQFHQHCVIRLNHLWKCNGMNLGT